MNLQSFHAWLFSALPASAGEIMAECQICHKAGIGAGLPKDALELTSAMAELAKSGLAEKRDGLWYWKAGAEKQEPQMELFA